MNEKVRTDFWRECDGEIYPLSEGESRSVLHDGSECPDCRYATNVEVLIAWLSADDERRKEIEIASRPTKAGSYKSYKWEAGTLQMTGWHFGEAWFDSGHTISGLWEPIE